MGAATSKTSKAPFHSTTKRASKRILKQNSTVYPSTVPCSENGENDDEEKSPDFLRKNKSDDGDVVLRSRSVNYDNSSSILKSAKKEKKKKKPENSAAGDDNVSCYHQTNVCYYKVESGKFLKLPNNTKHKSNDGSCYVKLSNGSFRHFLDASDEVESRPEVNIKTVRQSMPVQKTSDREEKPQQNRKVMVTMLDGGALTVLAVSKREKVSNPIKKEKEKAKV